MTKKLRLSIEALEVESFPTDTAGLQLRGTVRGHDSLDPRGPSESSCDPGECGCIPTALTCDPHICWGETNDGLC
jgi:hypothetical protein